MFGMPKVKVGLVGGQGYGKTVLLASLLELAHRDSGQSIRLWGSPNAKTQKKYTKWLSEFRSDGGRISSTTELLSVNYVLGASGSSQWKLQFKDFRGEDLDGDIEIEERDNGSSLAGTTSSNKDGKREKSNVERDKEALEKWFNSCDVLIFLLPVNVVKHGALVGSTDDVKSEKKLAILNAYVQQIKAKGKIACLALNKSDLVPDEMTCEDLIKEVPAIGKFYNALRACFGTENVFCHKVSAFGKHQEDSRLADARAEPVGVAEMLADVVPRAEEKRLERFFEEYKKAGEKSFLVRYALVPQLFWGTLRNAWRGIADADRRAKNLGMLKRSGRRFAIECTIVVTSIWGMMVYGNVLAQRRQYAKIDTAIENGFSDAQHIMASEAQMGDEPQLRLFNWNSFLLKNRRARLWERIRSEKLKFNDELAKYAEEIWQTYEGEIKDFRTIAPAKRSNDVEKIVRRALIDAQTKMTADAINQRNRMEKILTELGKIADENAWNYDIDAKFHEWNVISDQIEKCNKANDFIREFLAAKFTKRADLIETVKKEKRKIEDAEFERMTNALHQAKYADDYNEKTDGFEDRITRSNERITRIQELIGSLPNSERNRECRSLIDAERVRIDYLNRYGRYDADRKELQAHSAEKTYVELVENFLNDHPKGSYSKRLHDLLDLEKFLTTNEVVMAKNAKAKIATEELSDSTNLLWQVRLERVEKRIEIVSNRLARLSKQSEKRKELAAIIEQDQELRNEIERLREYYVAFDSTMAKEEEYRIKAINGFVKRYGNGQYPNVPALYSEQRLICERDRLERAWRKRLETAMTNYADNASKDWTARKTSARALREELHRYGVATGNDKEGEIKKQDEFIVQCDRNIEFDKAYEAVLRLEHHQIAKDVFSAIYDFYAACPEREWSSRMADYKRIQSIEETRLSKLRRALKINLQQNQEDGSIEDATTSCRTRIALWQKYRTNFHSKMNELLVCDKSIQEEEKRLVHLNGLKSLRKKIDDLLVEARSLESGDEDGISTFLSGVFEFSKALPEGEMDKLISLKYAELLKKRDEFDVELEKAMNGKLKDHREILQRSTLTDENRMSEEAVCIQIMEGYLSKFCPSGKIYPKVTRAYLKAIKDKRTLENLDAIRKALVELNEVISDTSNAVDEKEKHVSQFWILVHARGGEEAYPSLREEFGRLHLLQKDFQCKSRFEEKCARIKNEFKGFQDNEPKEKLDMYLSLALKYKSELEEFMRNDQTRDGAAEMLTCLADKEKRARNSLDGLRLWDVVEAARKEYDRSPSAPSYEKYETACKLYRNHPSVKISGFEETVKERRQMEKERIELEAAYKEFSQEPSVYRLKELIALKNKSPLLATTSIYRFANDCQVWQARGCPINVALKGYVFTGRFKRKRTVDFFAEMRIGGRSYFIIERDGIKGDDLNSPRNLLNSGFSPHQISHDIPKDKPPLNIGEEVEVQFVQKSWGNEYSGFRPVKLIKILAWASEQRGRVDVSFFDPKPNEDSKVTFSFSNLPYVEKE